MFAVYVLAVNKLSVKLVFEYDSRYNRSYGTRSVGHYKSGKSLFVFLLVKTHSLKPHIWLDHTTFYENLKKQLWSVKVWYKVAAHMSWEDAISSQYVSLMPTTHHTTWHKTNSDNDVRQYAAKLWPCRRYQSLPYNTQDVIFFFLSCRVVS